MSQGHISDDINSFTSSNAWNSRTVADEKSKILAWLSPLEPQIRHQEIRARRVNEVGEWLFQTKEYRNSFDGTSGDESDCAVLFCCGGPGVGKTYIR